MLPGIDGYRVLRTLREEGIDTPVLILSARGEETDKVRGFRLGADDYVAKPFGLLELLARVDALLRRASAAGSKAKLAAPVAFGDVQVDPRTHTVQPRGERRRAPAEGVRSVDRAAPAARASRVADRAARGGVGLFGRGLQPHGRHARRRAAAQARGERGGAAPHSHGAEDGLPNSRLTRLSAESRV